jgi:hypothetical protein
MQWRDLSPAEPDRTRVATLAGSKVPPWLETTSVPQGSAEIPTSGVATASPRHAGTAGRLPVAADPPGRPRRRARAGSITSPLPKCRTCILEIVSSVAWVAGFCVAK